MRSTEPRGLSVQRATQSTKSRMGAESGGQRLRLDHRLQVAAVASRAAQTTPVATRVPKGAATKSPGLSSSAGRDAIGIGGVDGDRKEHVDDAGFWRIVGTEERHGRSLAEHRQAHDDGDRDQREAAIAE